MLITFQPASAFGPAPAAITLVDDQGTPRIAGVIEEFSGEAAVQLEPLYAAANKVQFARGNVSGAFSFTATQSFPSLDIMLAFLASQYALLNISGTLTVVEGATTVTMAAVIMKSIKRAEHRGVRLAVRYGFDITAVTGTAPENQLPGI